MFFLHFMLFPTFLETKFGNTIYFYFFRKTILFHLMFSSCVLLVLDNVCQTVSTALLYIHINLDFLV